MTDSLGLYFHVPFCGKKCGYCDFYSEPYKKSGAESYVEAVLRNISHYSQPERTVDTVYFGGGTPSLLSPLQLDRILSAVRCCFSLESTAEITLEANPNTLTADKLKMLRETGINRLSIGVQSLDENELKLLGRTHPPQRAVKAVEDACAAGFDNISCDLMLALPGQTAEMLEKTVLLMTALPVQHISAYILKIEEGTPFFEKGMGSLIPEEDAAAGLYLEAVRLLEKAGFEQYEISNFAKSGFHSRHNCRYWECRDYLGIGPAAHSCYKGRRFAAEPDIHSFISSPVQPVTITEENPCTFEEKAMLRLRLKKGLDITETGSYQKKIEKKIPQLIQAGYARFDGRFLSLTPEGFLVSNAIISELIF